MQHKTLLTIGTILLLVACGNSQRKTDKQTEKIAKEAMESDKETDYAGAFNADGKNYKGKVSTQIFPSTKQFSVLCQADDDKGTLIQITFKDEISARKEQTLKIVEDRMSRVQQADEVEVVFDLGYASKDDSPGTIKVMKENGRYCIVFTDVCVPNTSGDEKRTISGKVPF
ncbi:MULTISPECIES: hypothetical protein [Chitinophagaceae]